VSGQLEGRAIVVTGAGAGIGRACALCCVAAGARVVVSDIDLARAEAVAAEIARPGDAIALHCDVANSDQVNAMAAACVQGFGSLDGWVNNAAHPGGGLLAQTPNEEWERIRAVTLDGVFYGIRAALGPMLEAGRGSIVNISSGAGLAAEPAIGPYGAAKAGVIALTRNAAVENARAGIRVNCIAPGPIDTEGMAGWLEQFPGGRAGFEAQIPQGRLGRPDEMAKVVLFLLSDESSFVNGAILPADGAVSARLASPRF
jgi:NAD(P)-dependent dehydrogenase (short-subunit alcohol dehydrogenase family)